MPDEDNKFLKYNSGKKSIKAPFIIYNDTGCLLKKIKTYQNNVTGKKAIHKPSG